MYSVRDIDNKAAMQIQEAMEGAKEFARMILGYQDLKNWK
jgi:hypothetical protein